MKVKPDLSFWKLWNISFGFFWRTDCIRPTKCEYQPHLLYFRSRPA